MQLLFLYMPGCHACAGAKPSLDAFERKNPHVKVARFDMSDPKNQLVKPLKRTDGKGEWEPDGFPTYVLILNDGRRIATMGGLTAPMLTSWIKRKSGGED